MNDINMISAFRRRRFPGLSPVLALVSAAIAINVPFLDQAFHMDDGLFLMVARNVRNNFWFPQDMPVLFEGLFGADLASTEHPWPVAPYLMALCERIGGFSEISLHAGFLVFPVILAVSTYAISRRFTHHPALASATLLCLPSVYVMSHTLMTDLPQLSLWLASMALFFEGVRSGRLSRVWIGTAVSSVALLLSYSGWCLILLLAFYAILHRNRLAATLAVAVPGSVFAAWVVFGYLHYNRVTPGLLIGAYLFVKRVLSPALLAQKSASLILSLGGVAVFPLVLQVVARKKALAAGILMAAASAPLLVGQVSGPWQKSFLVLFLGAGFTALIEVVCVTADSFAAFKRNRDTAAADLFLGAWFLGMFVFCLAVYMTGSSRYFLPALPPLVLILFRRIEIKGDERRALRVAAANLVLCGSLALALAIADYRFAGIYRGFASSLKTSWAGSGRQLWFAGEWGFRTYLERLGGREVGRRDARPGPGDWLVVPRLATPYQTLFSDTLALDTIVIVAPARLAFDTPPLPPGSALVYTVGMPFHGKSDGLDFTVRFRSRVGSRILHRERLLPADGRKWRVREMSLQSMEGEEGSIEFEAAVGATGNADADWLALARARICRREALSETVICDFRGRLDTARIDAVPGIQYHTDRNRPVLAMTTWLEQESAAVLRGTYEYSPAFPLRLLDDRCHAGFWGSSWGLLPFSFRTPGSSLESISVYEITRRVDAYGETPPSWYER